MTKKISRNNPNYFHLNVSAIDLVKLAKTPDCKFILRILRIYNDISVTPYIDKRLDQSKSPSLRPMVGGVKWFLLRWRLSVAAEALHSVIEKITERQTKPDDPIWKLITENAQLKKRWDDVSEFLATGARSGLKINAKFIREKLTAHYDEGPTFDAFNTLIPLMKEDPFAQTKVGYHVHGKPDIYRNTFVDECVNVAWFSQYGVYVTEDGFDEEKLAIVADEIGELLSAVSNFVNELFISYCEENDLLLEKFQSPRWLPRESRKWR